MSAGAGEPPRVRHRAGDRLSAALLYALLTLRTDVFVVEQAAPYRELDGADLAATTTHVWIEVPAEAGAPGPVGADDPALGPVIAGTGRRLVAGARLLGAGGGAELGRIVVAGAHRDRGLGSALVRAGCEHGGRPLRLNAQAHLEAWYAAFGFVTTGAAFDWEGVAHVPMRLDA